MMSKENQYLLKEIWDKCHGHIPLEPVWITLDSGKKIGVYRKESTCKYVCTVTKSPDATKYKNCYTIPMDSNQERMSLVSPELKAEWFKDKKRYDYIGESSGVSNDEYDGSATFAKRGIGVISIAAIENLKPELEQISLW